MQRKAESVLGVESENDVSRIEPKFLRNASKSSVPIIQYKYSGEKGYHVSYGIVSDEEESKKLKEIADAVFTPEVGLKYKDAVEQIMTYTNLKIGTGKKLLTKMNQQGLTVQGQDKCYRRKQL